MKHPFVSSNLLILSIFWLALACARGGEEPTDPRMGPTPREATESGAPAPGPADSTVTTNDPGPGPVATGGDRDADGILDADDRCPDVPEDRDGFEDADGCPDPDNDADGVPDLHDRCPGDPEDLDGDRDDDGCPE